MTKIELHKQLCDQLADTYAKKNHDYGDSFAKVREKFPNAILIRLNDKLNRLETLMSGAEQRVNDESIEDSLIDLANYCLMEVVERRVDADKRPKGGERREKIIHCEYLREDGRCWGQNGLPRCNGFDCPLRLKGEKRRLGFEEFVKAGNFTDIEEAKLVYAHVYN